MMEKKIMIIAILVSIISSIVSVVAINQIPSSSVLYKDNRTVNSVLDELYENVDAIESDNTRLTSLEGKVNTLTSTHSSDIAGINNSITTINNKINEHNNILTGKQSTITGAATTITSSNLTSNRALISNSSGKVAVSAITSTELGYLDGVTSNVQTQINSRAKSFASASVQTSEISIASGELYSTTLSFKVPTNAISSIPLSVYITSTGWTGVIAQGIQPRSNGQAVVTIYNATSSTKTAQISATAFFLVNG